MKKAVTILVVVLVALVAFGVSLAVLVNARGGLSPSKAGLAGLPVVGGLFEVRQEEVDITELPAEPALAGRREMPFLRFGSQERLERVVDELETVRADQAASLRDLDRRRRELEAWEVQLAQERDTLQARFARDRQELARQRDDLAAREVALQERTIELTISERANLKKTAEIYAKMTAEKAAEILSMMYTDGQEETAVKLIYLMPDRNAAKAMEAITDAEISAKITEDLKKVLKQEEQGELTMDIATMIGVVAGFVVIIGAIFMGGGAGAFANVPAMLITMGGTMCATLVHFPLGEVMGIFGVIKRTFTVNIPPAAGVIGRMGEFARTARRDGVLALEESITNCSDTFLAKGLQLIVDGTDSDQIGEIMSIELSTLQRRCKLGSSILGFMGEAAPAFGMIGTLIGLVQMLRQMDDPSQIGAGMATALLTTFYGALMANLLFIPLAGKLTTRGKEEETVRRMMIEGLQGIQSGVNPRVLEDRLTSFLAPGRREPATQQ